MSKYGKPKASKDEWITPRYITQALGEFDLDPCAPHPDKAPWHHAPLSYSLPEHNGLTALWVGRVWLNPPYLNQAAWPWVAKLADHGNGTCLVNSTTDTEGFQKHILRRALAVFFLQGRISFFHVDGTKSGMPMQGSVLAAYSQADVRAMLSAQRRGLLRGEILL